MDNASSEKYRTFGIWKRKFGVISSDGDKRTSRELKLPGQKKLTQNQWLLFSFAFSALKVASLEGVDLNLTVRHLIDEQGLKGFFGARFLVLNKLSELHR
jgi:hypothetical protein